MRGESVEPTGDEVAAVGSTSSLLEGNIDRKTPSALKRNAWDRLDGEDVVDGEMNTERYDDPTHV